MIPSAEMNNEAAQALWNELGLGELLADLEGIQNALPKRAVSKV